MTTPFEYTPLFSLGEDPTKYRFITKEGIQIHPAYGHGIEYYNRGIKTIFDEMIANYGELVKSKKSELLLPL